MRVSSPTPPLAQSDAEEEERVSVMYMNVKLVAFYIVCACTMLVVLYFFYQYVGMLFSFFTPLDGFNDVSLVYAVIALYCFSAVSAIVLCSNLLLNSLNVPFGPILPIAKISSISLRKVGEILFALSVVVFWIVARHNSNIWILQDLLGCSLILAIFRSLRIPNLKVPSSPLPSDFL